jgi:hypothetical protein
MEREKLKKLFDLMVEKAKYFNADILDDGKVALLWSAIKIADRQVEIEESKVFKVGDYVKIVNQDHLNQHLIGFVGPITNIDGNSSSLPFEVKLPYHGYCYFNESEFEKYTVKN